MSRLDCRLGKLEQRAGLSGRQITAICLQFFSPGEDGPVDEGVGIVHVLNGGEMFVRENFATDVEFWAAASTNHLKICGRSLEQIGRTTT